MEPRSETHCKARAGLVKLQQNYNVNSTDKNGIETLIAETVTVFNTAVESCTTRKKASKMFQS